MARALAGRLSDRPADAPGARPWVPAALALLSIALLVAFVQRRVLGTFFALDDLVLFQQVHGVIAWPAAPWRWLSGVAWFRAVTPLWGEQPLPYHVASLVLHATNACLLGRLARRWGASRPAAWLAAGLFAASPLHFPALVAATSVGELLALTGALGALLLAAPGWRSAGAPFVFLLALLAKENVLLVPLAALAVPVGGGDVRARLRRIAPLALTGALAGAALLAWGIRSGRLAGRAYAAAPGANVIQNVARYASWSLWPVQPIPDQHAGMDGLSAIGWCLAAIALTLLAAGAARRPLVRAGAAWWWLALLPVLPLVGRSYLPYLYAPLAGLALLACGGFDALAARPPLRGAAPPAGSRAAWLVAGALLAGYAAFADHQLAARTSVRMPSVDWPLDPVLRKSEIARRSITDVKTALAGGHAKVAVLLLASGAEGVDVGTGRGMPVRPGARFELETVLDDGRSLRAFVPGADSVEFVHDYVSGHRDFRFFYARADEHLVELGRPPEAHGWVISTLLANHRYRAAVEYADKAVADLPREPAFLYLAACAHERAGEAGRGLELMRELVRVAPGDSLATEARRVLARAGVAP